MKRDFKNILVFLWLGSFLAGCVVHASPARRRAPGPKTTVVVKERRLPKRVIKRKRPQRPGQKYEWVKGHWAWSSTAGKYVWEKGHWERQKVSHRWVRGHYEWKARGNHRVKVWVKGHWEATNAPASVDERRLPKAPPSSVRKPRRPAPQAGKYEWVKGHWAWSSTAGKYVWEKGHWERQKVSHRWVPGHYEWKARGNHRVKVWVKGHWEATNAPARVEDRRLPKASPSNVRKPRRPAPQAGKYEWVKGHWAWSATAGKYVWEKGHWERQKVSHRWVPGHYEWKARGNHRVKVWVKGHWEATNAPARVEDRRLPKAPPSNVRKPRRPAQSGQHEWVKGHWEWNATAGKYVWAKGHWELQKATHAWVPGHYEWKVRGNHRVKVWVKGHWQKSAKTQASPAPARVRQRDVPERRPRSASARPNPRRGFIWVKGHWEWNLRADKYVWVKGRYAKQKQRMTWQNGRYEWKMRGNTKVKVWVPGRWIR